MSTANKKRWAVGLAAAVLIGGCVFAGTGNAALVSSLSFGSGDIVALSNSLTWSASNGAMQTVTPLAAGQELVQGSYQENLLGYKVSYQGVNELNNTEIITQNTARDITAGKVVYSESILHSGYQQSDQPGILCANLVDNSETAATIEEFGDTGNETANMPYNVPYSELVMVSSGFMADSLAYQSETQLTSLDVSNDALHVRMAGAGSGTGTMTAAGYSMSGYSNCSSLGYTNQFSEKMTVMGDDFEIGKVFSWSSFHSTFDLPTVSG